MSDANPVPPEPGVGAIVRLTDAEGNSWIAERGEHGQWRVAYVSWPSWEHVVEGFGPEVDILRDPDDPEGDDPEGDAHRACKRAGMVAVKLPSWTPDNSQWWRNVHDSKGTHAWPDYCLAIADGLEAQEALR